MKNGLIWFGLSIGLASSQPLDVGEVSTADITAGPLQSIDLDPLPPTRCPPEGYRLVPDHPPLTTPMPALSTPMPPRAREAFDRAAEALIRAQADIEL